MTNSFTGVFLIAIGGLAAASFYIPYKKVKEWSWETYWLIQGLVSWVIMPLLVAYLTTPDLRAILSASPSRSMLLSYLFGVAWGFGGLTFGLSMRYLGVSLGIALALGFCATFGTIIPPIYAGTAANLFTTASGLAVLTGVIVCMVGISICGYAGVLKERELTEEQKRSAIKEFALTKGFMVALFAGIMSACMAFAIQAGKPIARVAVEAGTPSVYQNNPVFIFAMGGGFTTNCVWCLILILKNKSIGDFTRVALRRLSVNYLLALIGGATWYMQFFFYGMGTTKLGKEYDFASWTILMAFIILFSNFWGMAFNEWKGSSRKTLKFVFLGLFVLLFSTLIIGYGNYIVPHR